MSLALRYSLFHTHKMSDRIDRHIIDFLCRREEVVTYEAAGIGKKLGASASHRGLNAQEQAVYKRSLGDLCNQLIRASQTSLAATEERQKQRMASSFGKVIFPSSTNFCVTFQRKRRTTQIESDSLFSP